MNITLTDAAIGSGLGAPVPPLTLDAGPGVTLLAVETAERPMLVSMLLGGRLHVDSGSVETDSAKVALVDTPVVAEPVPGVSLMSVVAEEFSFTGRSASRSAVRAFLEQHELLGYAKVPVRALPPADRVRLFSELALLRDGVEALVVTSPERHGGNPADWFGTLTAIGERGITVIVVTDLPTAELLS
jgi:ABC-2 type transport system ATP-binding protein